MIALKALLIGFLLLQSTEELEQRVQQLRERRQQLQSDLAEIEASLKETERQLIKAKAAAATTSEGLSEAESPSDGGVETVVTIDTYLFKRPTSASDWTTRIPRGSKITVLEGPEAHFMKVRYKNVTGKNVTGFVHEDLLDLSNVSKHLLAEMRQRADEKARRAKEQAKEEAKAEAERRKAEAERRKAEYERQSERQSERQKQERLAAEQKARGILTTIQN